jgi:hypothetical protein
MLQTSFKVLVVAVLLALGSIVAYALLQLGGGPDQAIERARGFAKKQEWKRALNELDLIERGLTGDPARMQQLWKLRYEVNTALGDPLGALRDLDNLLSKNGDDLDLRLDRVRLLALAGDGPGARLAALEILAEHPDHGRALELAGEACQTIYQPQLRELRQRLDRDLPATVRQDARKAMLSFLYRADGDPEVLRAAAELERAHQDEPRRRAAWESTWTDLQRLRTAVQEGLTDFRRALETDGKPVAAFRAFVWSLDQSERDDDVLMACEIQRRRFDHEYVVEAGATAAWSLLRDELTPAALATAKRWLPKPAIAERIARKWSDDGANDLLLARALAAWRLQDAEEMARTWFDVDALSQANKSSRSVTMPVTGALLVKIQNNTQWLANNLRWATEVVLQQSPPAGRPDLAELILPLQLELLQTSGRDPAMVQSTLANWSRARPDAIAPQRALADHLALTGRLGAALQTIDAACSAAPDDHELVARRIEIARLANDRGEQSGLQLLTQCLRRGQLLPEVVDPIGYLLCAEVAAVQKVWPVAIACARAAVDAFPAARAPRQLEIQVHLAADRGADAALLARRTLELLPADAATVDLAIAAYRAAGLPLDDLVFHAMPTSAPTPALQTVLLRTTLRAKSPELATPFAARPLAADELPLRILRARALARSGRAADAEPLLAALLAETELGDAERDDLLHATLDTALALADVRSDDQLTAMLTRMLAAIGELPPAAADELLQACRTLADDRPRAAMLLVDAAVPTLPPERRTAAVFQLAGRLCARNGWFHRAEEHLTAALGFADGERSAELLVRLCVALGRSERARQVLPLVTTPHDPALAASLEQPELAVALLAHDLQRDRGDLLAHCLLATFGQPSRCDLPPATGAEAAERFELLATLRDPATAALAMGRLEALAAAAPQVRTWRLLLARALLHAGRAARAAELHAELAGDGQANVLLWREASLAHAVDGYVLPAAIRQQLIDAVASEDVAASPPTFSFAMECVADAFAAGGLAAAADDARLRLLAVAPPARALRRDELDLIERMLAPTSAWQQLLRELEGPYSVDRDDLIPRLCTAAAKVAAQDPKALGPTVAAAWRLLDSDGPRGELVHFLLQHDERLPKRPSRIADLLRAHLQRVAAGDESARWLPQTITALRTAIGTDATSTEIETALQAHPATLALWAERAALRMGSRTARKAIADLRAVLRHGDTPELQLRLLLLAAEGRSQHPDDAATYQALPLAVRATPEGAYTAAMMALRLGNAEAALALFPFAAPRDNGMHLFGQALAWLQSPAADGPARARELLQRLVRDYPSSSAARNAGSFAAQLAPR